MSIANYFKTLIMRIRRNPDGTNIGEMSFLDHLEELRWDLIKILIGLIIATTVAGIYSKEIVEGILLRPLLAVHLKPQVLTPYGIVLMYMETALFCGFILNMPNTLFWLWHFVKPGLFPKERKYIAAIVAFTSLCFFSGIAFGYFILLPTSLQFFSTFGTDTIQMNIAIDRYISFILALILGCGLVFELPMITFFLSKMGILTPTFMRKYRRHAIVIILFIAAIVTPTPDPITQSLLALPLLILYEFSIWVSMMAIKPKKQSQEINT